MLLPAWPDEKIELLQKYFNEGCSNLVISHRMGEQGYLVTKNAVIGKLYRLGLIGNKKLGKDKPAPQRIKKPVISPPKPPRPIVRRRPPKVKVPPVIVNGAHHIGGAMTSPPDPKKQVLLRETNEEDCRAIVGYRNGILADAVCCGEPTIWKVVNGKRVRGPWCDFHNKRFISEVRKR